MLSAKFSLSSRLELSEDMRRSCILSCSATSAWYGKQQVLDNINLEIPEGSITSLIGPSGCGKSTLLRMFNRMNDLIAGFKMQGELRYKGLNIYDKTVDPVFIRRHIGMVFQKPNPFPGSISHNISWAPKLNGYKGSIPELVESCLRKVSLWDEVKDKLSASGLALSGGQQQRLCIARALAMQPELIVMDEPASALDPVSTAKIEELILDLKRNHTILIVTHNMQQAVRISDFTAFMLEGRLIEFDRAKVIFHGPRDERTRDYVNGRFG